MRPTSLMMALAMVAAAAATPASAAKVTAQSAHCSDSARQQGLSGRARADFVIDTSLALDRTREDVRRIVSCLRVPQGR